MNLKEIETRMGEIKELLNSEVTDEQVDELTKEVESLKEERKALTAEVEKRDALIQATLEGEGKVIEEVIEERKENKNMFDVNTVEYRNAFLKGLQGKELSVEERAVVSASAVIPTTTLNKIYEKLEQVSVLLPFVSQSRIPGAVSIPVENAKNDANWVAMGTAATDSEDSFAAVSLSAYKLIKTVEIGADVASASIDAFEMFLVDALAKKIARAADYAIAKGTGSSQATGLLKSGEITNTGTFTKAGMTHADILTIIADLGAEYRKNAKFVMPSALFFGDVVPALAEAGIGVDAQDALKYQIHGYQVVLNDNFDADTLVFGDLSYYHWNWAQEPMVEADRSAGFRTGSVVYRGMALADGKPLLAEAFNKYTRAAS